MKKEFKIYEYQLKRIQKTLDLTIKYSDSSTEIGAYDRMVMEAKYFVDNALKGDIEKSGYDRMKDKIG